MHVYCILGSVQVLHKRRRGGEGGLTSIAYVAYTFREGGGVSEQNAYVIFELSVLPKKSSWPLAHVCINPTYGPI